MTQPTLVRARPSGPTAISRINPRDTYNFLPVFSTATSVLDVGSGPKNRWVVVGSAQRLTVVDPFLTDEDFHAGQQAGIRCVRESGEAMHSVSSSAYDMVISRVSLPYMRPHPAIDEFARALVPGGRLFLTLHDAPSIWRHLLDSIRKGHWKAAIKRGYTLVNGAWIAMGGRAFALPFSSNGAVEWYQSEASVVRLLREAGFDEIETTRRPRKPGILYTAWCVTARKR